MKVISREKIGYSTPRSQLNHIGPVPRLWIHHLVAEAHREPTWSERTFNARFKGFLREVEAFHINSRGMKTIAYSIIIRIPFLGKVKVYDGRGVGVEGGHTAGDNSSSLAIALEGNFMARRFPKRMRKKVRKVTDWLAEEGWVTDPRKTLPTGGHRDAPGAATACPGDHVMEHMSELRKPLPPPQVVIVARKRVKKSRAKKVAQRLRDRGFEVKKK